MPTFLKQKPLKILLEFLKFLLLFIIIYTIINYWRQPTLSNTANLIVNDSNHQIVDMANMSRDKPILVYFWATWCHICKHTTPNVLALADDVPVVAVAVNSGDDVAISQYLSKYAKPAHLTLVNDESGEYFGAWQGQVTPSFVIIKDGKAVQSFVGLQPKMVLKARMALAKF